MKTSKFAWFILCLAILMISACQSTEKTDTAKPKAADTDTSQVGIESANGVVPTSSTYRVAGMTAIKSYIQGYKKHKITKDEAILQLRLFKTWADLISVSSGSGLINWSDAMYGYYFDFNTLYNYMDSIRRYNDAQKIDSLKIDGLRLYHGAKLLSSGFMPDVFFYPTRDTLNIDTIDADYVSFRNKFLNGNKFVDEAKFLELLKEEIEKVPVDEGGNGYNATFPCPQQCP